MSDETTDFRRSFPGNESSLEGVLEEILEFLARHYGTAFRNVFATELVLREVITNSIRYGSPNGEDVSIEVELSEADFRIRLYDSGPLFSLEPKCSPDSLQENSRGLWILQQFTLNSKLLEDPKCLAFTLPIIPMNLNS